MSDIVEGKGFMGLGREEKGEFLGRCRYMCRGFKLKDFGRDCKYLMNFDFKGLLWWWQWGSDGDKRMRKGFLCNEVFFIYDKDFEFYFKGLGDL